MDQSSNGDGNMIAGRDIYTGVNQEGTDKKLLQEFKKIDQRIFDEIGKVLLPGNNEINFESARLCESLINIGIRPHISIAVCLGIFPYIRDAVDSNEGEFSTADIRRAVSLAITGLPGLEISQKERSELAAKYARNYGNPRQINMVVFGNGATQPLTYKYLREDFLPTLLGELAGRDYDHTEFMSNGNFEYMCQEIVECVKRLGIYQIRHATLRALAEDLATQPPHPWVAHIRNRKTTMEHDLDRIQYHLSIIQGQDSPATLFWRSAHEAFNHSCSLMLAHYACPIGGGTHAPSNTLRNITRLKANGRHQNIALWDFSSISEIEDDLLEFDYTVDKFHNDIKQLQKETGRMRFEKRDFVRRNVESFSNLCVQLVSSLTSPSR